MATVTPFSEAGSRKQEAGSTPLPASRSTLPASSPSWQRTVHAVAAKVRHAFPSLGGKIDHATALVLASAVEPAPELGPQRYTVASQSDPTGLKVYDVTCGTPATCTCEAYMRHAPREVDYRCKHIFSVWIYRRALAQQTPAPVASAALPEAAFSLTLKGIMDGQEAMLTVRGQTPEEFKANLAGVRGLFDASAPPPSPPPTESVSPDGAEVRYCPLHGSPMHIQVNDRGSWWSHKHGDGWCKGKRPKG
jgi:hypothetical protein